MSNVSELSTPIPILKKKQNMKRKLYLFRDIYFFGMFNVVWIVQKFFKLNCFLLVYVCYKNIIYFCKSQFEK